MTLLCETDKILESESRNMFGTEHNYNVDFNDMVGSSYTRVKKDMPTRWNSLMLMMKSFVKNNGEIIALSLKQ